MTRHKWHELKGYEQKQRYCVECGRKLPLISINLKPDMIPLCRFCRAKKPKSWDKVKYLIEGDE